MALEYIVYSLTFKIDTLGANGYNVAEPIDFNAICNRRTYNHIEVSSHSGWILKPKNAFNGNLPLGLNALSTTGLPSI